MKMSTEHYQFIKSALDALPKDAVSAHKALKLGTDKEMRFRWDLFHAAKLSPWASQNCYSYLNDNHIDTALKSIVRELAL